MEDLIATISLVGGVALGIGLTAMCARLVLSFLPAVDELGGPQTDP